MKCIDKVIADEQRVLLKDGFWLGTQGMQATSEEILVLANEAWIPLHEAIKRGNFFVWQWRKCKGWNPEGTSRCGNCGRSRGG